MLSLITNNRQVKNICFHVLDGGISESNKDKLTSMVEVYKLSIRFYPVREVVESGIKNQKISRGSYSMFSRLFVDQFLPQDLTRILYLDCDTLILDKLDALWNTEFEDKTLVAVNDCFSTMHRKQIGLHKKNIYFNSGVLLINMVRWRQSDVEKKICTAMAHFPNLHLGDQGALNVVLSSHTKMAHPKYNCLPYAWEIPYGLLLKLRNPTFYYTEQEFNEAVGFPTIVHFATFFLTTRPWIESVSKNDFTKKWRYFRSISPWKDEPLWPDNSSLFYRITIKIFHLLPHKIAISIVGILHAHIMPLTGILLRGRKQVR